jgi:hypothetical protein
VSSLALPGRAGAPDDEISDTVCPIRSGTTAMKPAGDTLQKISTDVGCRKSCMWFMPTADGRPRCAVFVLALAVEERA